MKEFVLQDDMPISVDDFWALFFRDAEFTLVFHEAKGDSDTQVGSWTVAPEGRKQRVVRYLSPTASNSFMRRITGVTTQIKEIQLCYFRQDGSFVLQSAMLFEKQSLVEMDSHVDWEVLPTNKGCHITIKATNEYKGNLFKEPIENYIREVTEEGFDQWLALAHSKIADYQPTPRELEGEKELDSPSRPVSDEGMGDESEEDGFLAKKEQNLVRKGKESKPPRRTPLRESATERAKRIIARKEMSDSSSSEDEDETDEMSYSEEDDEEENTFYESTDELSALARLESAQTTEERFALLQAYSRAMQMELNQLKEMVMTVQTRMMRMELQPPVAAAPATPQYGGRKNGFLSPLTQSQNGIHGEDKDQIRYRDLVNQTSLANMEKRLAELEQAIARTASVVPAYKETKSSLQSIQQKQQPRRGLLPLLTSNSWLINVPFIVFVICWPLVSHRVLGWGSVWGYRIVATIQKLFASHFGTKS